MKIYRNLFNDVISAENLFSAWDKFKNGKRNKKDVQLFEWSLEENIFKLHRELKSKTYKHSNYISFNISDPKLRNIHKAQVRDRILHHAVFRVLNPVFEAGFISASFSCRVGYGTHKGVGYLQNILRKASKNGRIPCFVLKCDIKKFFDTIGHNVLLAILKKKIKDEDTIWLLKQIVSSFSSNHSLLGIEKGVPIGNLTSQLFANIYLGELDRFIKQELKVKYYLRYTDDFLMISENKEYLENIIPQIDNFLGEKLKLYLHSDKMEIRRHRQGIDFLGYVSFPRHRILRTKTKRRMFKKTRQRVEELKRGEISKESFNQTIQSYLGMLKHCNSHKLKNELLTKLIYVN